MAAFESTPSVTVLLPVRNGAVTLAGAARSILGQSFGDFELLIVDDGSSDATAVVIAALAGEDGRVRVIRQAALGLVAALNRGLEAAEGALVARMDADDLAHPTRLARQTEVMAARPAVGLLGSGWRVVAADGTTRRVVTPPASEAGLRAAMAGANALAHPTVMMRREAALRAGGYRAAFVLAEDYDLWLRMMDRCEIASIEAILLDYREHPGQSAWRDLEQRILSELGALAAAGRRQSGQTDFGDDPAAIDRARLALMRMSPAAISAGVVARALGAAKDARAAGFGRAMREAVLLGGRERGMALRTRAHFALLWAQSFGVR